MTLSTLFGWCSRLLGSPVPDPPPPMILAIPRRPRTLEEAENEICSLRDCLRNRGRLANDLAAANAKLRLNAKEMARMLNEKCRDLVMAESLATRRKAALKRIAPELRKLRSFRRSVEKGIVKYATGLVLEPEESSAKVGTEIGAIADFVVSDAAGHLASVAVGSADRGIVAKVIGRIIPTFGDFDVKLADRGDAQAETKS